MVCLTTAARWKNWPLRNFRALLARFPNTRFVLTGFGREVAQEETSELEAMLRQSMSLTDSIGFRADELVRPIAHARAVVTNDTSAAHIANLLGVGGAVVFGPVSPGTFASPSVSSSVPRRDLSISPLCAMEMLQRSKLVHESILPKAVGDYLATLPGLAEPTKPGSPINREPGREIAAPPRWEGATEVSSKSAARGSEPQRPPPAHGGQPFHGRSFAQDAEEEIQESCLMRFLPTVGECEWPRRRCPNS